eukprot:SAG31_NODE_41051_length_278_cov_0.569832_2_plen_34_part_01
MGVHRTQPPPTSTDTMMAMVSKDVPPPLSWSQRC